MLKLFSRISELRGRTVLETHSFFLRGLVVLIALLFIWACFAKIDRVVRVEGKIIPAGRSQEVQHLEGGIVSAIHIVEGQTVKRGDLLLTIDDTAAGAGLGETQTKLEAQQTRAVRLEAEIKGLDKVEFPPELASLPMAREEASLFLSRKQKLSQQILVYQSAMQQHKAELEETVQRIGKLDAEMAVAAERSRLLSGMVAKGAASKLESLDAQSRETRLKTEMSDAKNAIPKLNGAIEEDKARITAAEAEFINESQNEMVTVLAETERLKKILTAEADRVNRTEVRSPIDGTVNHISVNTVGGVVKPGENLVQLIPNTDQALIEAKARPQDRGYLHPGLISEIRVSAYDAGEFGVIQGRVTDVSADSMQPDPKSESYYRVNVLVDKIPDNYKDKPMIPGMMVTADIVTGRRTVAAYLLSPLRKFVYNAFRDAK